MEPWADSAGAAERGTHLRWSSMRQLASSMAVGLAMFLSAMLLPVFLVALRTKERSHQSDSQRSRPREHQAGDEKKEKKETKGALVLGGLHHGQDCSRLCFSIVIMLLSFSTIRKKAY